LIGFHQFLWRLLALASLLLCSEIALSAPDAWAQCATCHGSDAGGNRALKAPALAGQKVWYLVRQLENFASGIRGSHPDDAPGMQMRAMATTLGDEQRRALADYLSELEPPSTQGTRRGDMKNGYRYYQARCGSCHGSEGQGNEAFQAPALQGLSAQYLDRQMRNFRNGRRGTHPDDKYGRQMSLMADTISEDEWRDILYFLTEQR